MLYNMCDNLPILFMKPDFVGEY